MVRLQDKLMSVDLFSAELRLIGASQSSRQISAKQSANEAGAASSASGLLFIEEQAECKLRNCDRHESILLEIYVTTPQVVAYRLGFTKCACASG